MPLTLESHTNQFATQKSSLYTVLLAPWFPTDMEYFISSSPDSSVLTGYTTVSRDKVKSPNWRVAAKSGSPPMNPYEVVREKAEYAFLDYTSSKQTYYDREDRYKISGIWPDPATGPSIPISKFEDGVEDLRAKVEQALLLKVKRQRVNVGIMYAERKKTAQTIATMMQRVARAYQKARRGDLAGAANILGVGYVPRRRGRNISQSDRVASGWLELQYGWMPLLSDIEGAATLLHEKYVSKFEHIKSVRLERSSYGHTVELPSSVYSIAGKRESTLDITIRAVVYFKAEEEVIRSAVNLGLVNPASVAWEVVPFSFVVDWFLPIGNFLSSLDATLGVTFSRGCISIKTVEEQKVNFDTGQVSGGYSHNGGFVAKGRGSSSYRKERFQRILYTDFPNVAPPQFKDPVSLLHIANALALIKTISRGK